MLPSQENQQSSSKNVIKRFLRNPFSSNSGAHNPPPNTSVDVTTTSSPRPANISSGADLILGTYTTSTPRSALYPTGSDSRSPTILAAGDFTSGKIGLTTNRPDVTSLPTPDHGQSSTTKRSLSLLWHGFEQLLKRIEPCLAGTPAKVPVNVLNTIINIGKAVVDNKGGLAERVAQTVDRLNVVNDALLQTEPDGAVGRAMLTFAEKLVDEAVMLKGMSSNPIWERIIKNEEDAKKIEGSFKRLDEHTKDFQLEIMLSIERNTNVLSDRVTRLQLESLRCAREALYNAAVGDSNTLAREPCTPETRVSILEHIYQWAQDSSSNSPRIFWLTGDAGSGKSTIAYTVAGHFDDKTKNEAQQLLRANFFCSRQFEKTRRREYIIPTIVYQLAHRSRSYARALLGSNKFGSADVLSDQMKDLLVDPWEKSASKRPSELPPYLVVIDALDEIDGQGGPAFLRELLMTVDEGRLRGLKFLITSRPHPEVASLCATLSSDAVCRLYDVPMDTVKTDILTYLKVKLPDLQDEPQLTYLAEKADGLFIYAATVVRYIRPRDKMGKREQLSLMQKLSEPTWPVSSMSSLVDKLYQQILQEAFVGLEKELFDARLSILHTFLCTVERVSPPTAANLISDPEMEDIASFIVSDLHAVLYINEGCVFWYHASFQDFIFSKTRPKFTISGHDVDMSCDVATHNAVLTRRCFRIMMSKLRFNICNLPSSFLLDSEVSKLSQLIQKNIDNVLRYSSRYWAQHLARAAANDHLRTCIQDFLVIRVLFWIEAMNLLGLGLECSSMLQQARNWVLEVDEYPSDLIQDITEAANFATYFVASPAALSTPQIYISSLATWSRDSTMSQMWKRQFSRVPSFTITKSVDDVALMSIPIGDRTSCVAFSIDGNRIVSGSEDKSVRVWDSTGVELKKLNGHTGPVRSVAFSRDGTCIVSSSSDESVRVWDALTGAELKKLNGHTDSVKSVAFSSDGTRIVSDRSVRVWDALTGLELKTLNGHTGYVQSVAFSRDGTRIVSGSADRSVRIWDTSTGVELKTLNGHTGSVWSVAFSSDGRIVSGSGDKSVRMWDASTGVELKTLNGHTEYVHSVAFSRDGTRIVSGSADRSVRIWDMSTGVELKTLNGHTGSVWSVAFSIDGTRIISGSYDNSVRMWDASTGLELKTLNGHTSYVQSVAFSGDGTRIVSGSNDKSVQSVAFSGDGTRIVSGSYDTSVRVWDTLTGTVKRLNGHTDFVRSVGFSSDDTQIVSGSDDESVRVWDASTGAELKRLNGHTDFVRSVACSSDGTLIVSGSSDKSVGVWDASTGVELKRLNGHTEQVQSIAFSKDGTRIVSGSDDTSVRVWDLRDDGRHWILTPENWIVSFRDQDRFMWVPSDIREVLHHPHNILTISRKGSATVNFTHSKIGTVWGVLYTVASVAP